MKVGIITHYDVHNHGAILQMYALQQVVRELGGEVEGLTFQKSYDFIDSKLSKKYEISLKSIPYYTKYLLKNGINKTYFNYQKKRLLDLFKKNKKMIGRSTKDSRDLDVVFIGADEVFSIEIGLTPEFWGGDIKCKNIFSYAGCFGPTTLKSIEDKNATDFILKGIDRLKRISVRDKNSKEIIEELSSKKALLVCDPVILYGYMREIKEFKNSRKEKYILIYSYDNNMNKKEEIENIKKFAKKENIKILSVGFYHEWCDESINVSPIDLIEYIKNAEYVFTDTFHGTVISLITGAQFITKVHTNANKLGFLLEEYNMSVRKTEDFSNIEEIIKTPINYNQVNEIINERREVSLNYLKECLESIKNA